jgi:hypothetical protein
MLRHWTLSLLYSINDIQTNRGSFSFGTVYVPADWVCPETQTHGSSRKTSVEIRQRDCVTYMNAILGKNHCKTIILWKGFEIGLVPNTSNSCWCHVKSTSLLGMHINVWPNKEELTNNYKYGSSSSSKADDERRRRSRHCQTRIENSSSLMGVEWD